jgi:medium-chain acyl-[acyl-carrier-protein] hydrolase
VNALRELPPAPFAFFGHSMGALICFAVMCELRRLELDMPARLFVSACVAPNHEQAGVHNLPEGEFQQTLVKKFAMPQEAVANERWWNSIQQTLRCDINLLESYKLDDAGPLNVPVTVLGGADDPVTSRQALLDWSAFTTTDFSLRLFPGDHMYIKQHESQVIEILKRELS